MNWLSANIQWVMLVSGALTSTMFMAAFAPRRSMQRVFGEDVETPAAELVVRNWGILIGMLGVLLLVGAFQPALRPVALIMAGASKLAFIGLVLAHGSRYLKTAGTFIVVDSIMIVLFGLYLLGQRG